MTWRPVVFTPSTPVPGAVTVSRDTHTPRHHHKTLHRLGRLALFRTLTEACSGNGIGKRRTVTARNPYCRSAPDSL